jgi:hypothetical protein
MTGVIQGKEILDNLLNDQTSQYISDFRNQRLDVPEDWDDSTRTRYMRLVGAYRALLSEHLQPPTSLGRARLKNLTSQDLRTALSGAPKYAPAAMVFAQTDSHWDAARTAWRSLGEAISDANSVYQPFNQAYAASHAGRDWHDAPLKAVLSYLCAARRNAPDLSPQRISLADEHERLRRRYRQ